jgi:hypothetical protein
MPQSANYHSVTKGQVNTLQALSVQLIVMSVQQFHRVIQIYSRGQVQLLPNGYYFTTHIHVACSITSVLDNHKGYYTVTTIMVNYSFNHGNIISVVSSVNSVISDYKK